MTSVLPACVPARGTTLTSAPSTANSPRILRLRPLRVAEIVEPIEQLLLRHVVAAPNLERPREDARQHAIALAVQARVDHPRERHVVVAGERAGDDEQHRDGDEGVLRRARVGRREPSRALASPRAGLRFAGVVSGLGGGIRASAPSDVRGRAAVPARAFGRAPGRNG